MSMNICGYLKWTIVSRDGSNEKGGLSSKVAPAQM